MLSVRIIPCLLLKDKALVKTVRFRSPRYLGDPLNAVKIFNEKEADELIFLDISATIKNRRPDFTMVSNIASECFMPLSYGGGIRNIQDMKELFKLGVEKIIINTCAFENPDLIKESVDLFGSQSIIVSIDVKKNIFGKYEVFVRSGIKNTKIHPVDFAVRMEKNGAGEIFLNSIDRDGTMSGYDIDLIKHVSMAVRIPVIASGGAGKISDFYDAVKIGKASAVAAGSFFVFKNKTRAFLINMPTRKELEAILG